MAQVMQPTPSNMFSMTVDANVAPRSRPHTPPYTPHRRKTQLERNSSPAPSIHPAETTSPAKQQQQQGSKAESQDTVIVRELDELEVAHLRHTDFVLPAELEEQSDDECTAGADAYPGENESAVDESEAGIAGKLARMHCDDSAGETERRKMRRDRRSSKRMSQRFKRSHSASIKSDSEVTDQDALDDHDLSRSARRLRRKVAEEDTADIMVDTPIRDDRSDMSAEDDSPTRPRVHPKRSRQPFHAATPARGLTASNPPTWQARESQINQDDEMHLSD